MWTQDIISHKLEARDAFKAMHNLPKRSKILVGIHLHNKVLTSDIANWLNILPANFVVFWKNKWDVEEKNIVFLSSKEDFDLSTLDAIVCNCDDVKIEKAMEVGVVPIVNEKNYLGKILTEFHPGRAEGNAYLYEDTSYWSAYYALIRYLENHKFPYDNRNLVKNVLWV